MALSSTAMNNPATRCGRRVVVGMLWWGLDIDLFVDRSGIRQMSRQICFFHSVVCGFSSRSLQ